MQLIPPDAYTYQAVFGIGQFNPASQTLLRLYTPVAMLTKIWKFEYKVNVIGLHDSHNPRP